MNPEEINSLEEKAEEVPEEIEGELKEVEEQQEEKAEEKESVNSSGEKEDDGEKMVQGVIDEVLGTEEKKEEEGTDIPDAFTKACKAEGWTDDEIKEFAQDLDDKDLLAELIIEEKEEPAKQETKEEKSKPAEKSGDEPTNKELAELKKELAEVKASIGEAKEARDTKDDEAMVQTVNQVFDEANKSFEIFGKTEELLKYPAGPKAGQVVPTSPAMKVRQEVWDKAAPFIKGGVPVKEAMEFGLTWYKGEHLEKDVERKYIKDLKKHETKLSAKRVGKRTVRIFEDEEERKAEVVLEARRKAKAKHRI